MTALYSINLHIMGKSNVPLLSVTTLATQSERIGVKLMHGATQIRLAGMGSQRARCFGASRRRSGSGTDGRVALSVLPHRSRHGHASHGRQRADDSRAGRE